MIVAPTRALNQPREKHFRGSCQTWQGFLKLADGLIRATERVRQTRRNTPLWSATPLLPDATAPFSIISDRPGRTHALCSNSILQRVSGVRSQTETLLGFHIDSWITGWWSWKKKGTPMIFCPLVIFQMSRAQNSGVLHTEISPLPVISSYW